MSGGGSGGAAQQSPHSLAFRVMRLCRPTVHVDTSPLKFDPCDLLFGEDLFDNPTAVAGLPRLLSSQSNPSVVDPSDLTYRNRFLHQHPTDSLGLPGLLVLAQSFGAIYLGETFCSYISINNNSSFEVRDVVIKNLIAVKLWILKISGITVFDTIEKKTYDSLLELEIYVDSE
ncbi:Unknown protein [Striga hermonthica]|uniref:Trafficking protein particle complex subunit 13 N-terminal domain-containing protein n=1 Tax=Striga hermonthica TaxID=68872 RepID=A0A9N7NWG6_STRHE|nr:Unknown protein [Striga hermonthica]